MCLLSVKIQKSVSINNESFKIFKLQNSSNLKLDIFFIFFYVQRQKHKRENRGSYKYTDK